MRTQTIVTCVNYSDFLSLTLPHNLTILPDITVATSPEDVRTRELCEQLGVGVFTTDCWTQGGAIFNKARALDLALDYLELLDETWAVVMDADILLPMELNGQIDDLHPDCLFSIHRHMCRTPQQWTTFLSERDARSLEVDAQPVINGKVWGHRPTSNPAGLLGYFQLWHPASHFQRFGSHPTAEGYDVDFALHWPAGARHFLPDVAAVHLGPEKRNWRGRVTDTWHDAVPFPAGTTFSFRSDRAEHPSTDIVETARPSNAASTPNTNGLSVPFGECLYFRVDDGETICRHPQIRSVGQFVSPPICLGCRHAERKQESDNSNESAPSNGAPRTERTFSWTVGVTTAPRRRDTLAQMLTSLADAGWDEPRVFAEPGVNLPSAFSHLPISHRDSLMGAFPNWYLALTEMVMREPDVDAYLLCQDDVILANGLREFLESELWPAPELGVVSVYCPSHYAIDHQEGFQVEDRGWNTWGAMAYVFPNRSARALLCDPVVLAHRSAGPHRGIRNVDSVVGDWCRRSGQPYFVHWPSLAQHIGTTSTLYPGAGARGRRRAHEAVLDVADLPPRGQFARRPQTRLVVEPIQGLCNRLRVLLSAMVLAELRGDELAMVWDPKWHCDARFSDLFLPICEEVDRSEAGSSQSLYHRGGEHPFVIWEKYVAGNFDLSQEEFVERVIQKAATLRPLDTHLQRVEDIFGDNSLDRWLGLHIRRTDFAVARGLGRRPDFSVAPDDEFATAIQDELEQDPQTIVYLATDNPKTRTQFVERFGESVCTAQTAFQTPRRISGRRHDQQRLTSVADALVDLYCLSRCRRIIGTAGSSFSAFAGWINQRPVQMV